jgi:two-component system cell cycle sensor histidine kinase/response regulator CckA
LQTGRPTLPTAYERAAIDDRFRAVFERAPTAMALLDVSGRIDETNAAFEQLLGYHPAALHGVPVHDVLESPAINFDDYPNSLNSADLSALAVCRGRHRRINVRVGMSAVRDEANRTQFVVLNVTEIAARSDRKTTFPKSQQLAAVARLAGGIAHNFNNLLTTITGLTDLLIQDLPAEDKARGDLSEIKKAGDRAALLTRQLLAFSGQQIRQPKLLEINTLIADVALTLERLLGENIELRIDAGKNLPRIKADSGQMMQVLLNLAVNAREAMPRGGSFEICTSMIDFAGDEAVEMLELAVDDTKLSVLPMRGSCVVIAISDTGRGISPEIRPHIFEPFFTTKEIGKGTGLGLATVYGIVKQSGGAMTLESEVGRGSTFTIMLPAAD